jgi:four helix bundle protein
VISGQWAVISGQWAVISGKDMKVRNYRDLIVWQNAMDLVEMVYKATHTFPSEEMFGLKSQLRRAAVSVPSNIAEGQGRHTIREFLHFLSISNGSLREIETQILIAGRLNYLSENQCTQMLELANEIGRLRNRLVASLKNK